MANTKSPKNILGTVEYSGTICVNIWKIISTSDADSISFYDEYIIQDYDRWDSISQKFYETPFLWWLICNYNKIKDPFVGLVAGEKIKIIKRDLITNIMFQLRELK